MEPKEGKSTKAVKISEKRSFGIIPLIKKGDNKYDVILINNISGAQWDFPKGKPEKEDKSTLDSAIREFQEELGTDYVPDVIKERSFKIEYEYSYKKQKCHKIVEFWVGFVKDKKVEDFKPQATEVKEIRIYDSKEALEKITHEESKKLLEEALAYLEAIKAETAWINHLISWVYQWRD